MNVSRMSSESLTWNVWLSWALHQVVHCWQQAAWSLMSSVLQAQHEMLMLIALLTLIVLLTLIGAQMSSALLTLIDLMLLVLPARAVGRACAPDLLLTSSAQCLLLLRAAPWQPM